LDKRNRSDGVKGFAQEGVFVHGDGVGLEQLAKFLTDAQISENFMFGRWWSRHLDSTRLSDDTRRELGLL
jgi:hypothetical protein